MPPSVVSSLCWILSVLCCGSQEGEHVDLTSVFLVCSSSDCHTFTFGLHVRVSVQWPSFLSSLSLSAHHHFWFRFIPVPDIGVGVTRISS